MRTNSWSDDVKTTKLDRLKLARTFKRPSGPEETS